MSVREMRKTALVHLHVPVNGLSYGDQMHTHSPPVCLVFVSHCYIGVHTHSSPYQWCIWDSESLQFLSCWKRD